MSESANDRALLSVFFILLFTGTPVVVTGQSTGNGKITQDPSPFYIGYSNGSVTLTCHISNATSSTNYQWSSNERLLSCQEIDASVNTCTFRPQVTDVNRTVQCSAAEPNVFNQIVTTQLSISSQRLTVTSPIVNISRSIDYYWYSSSRQTILSCDENYVSNNNCTYQFQDPREVFASLSVLDGIGFTVAFFNLTEFTFQPRDCLCFSLFTNVSNMPQFEFSMGCPCDGSYLNQLAGAVCNASGKITQSPSPYDYRNETNVTFTCLIDFAKSVSKVIYFWTMYNSSSSSKTKLPCYEPITSTNCTIPGTAELAGATVQCIAIETDANGTKAPCISTRICYSNDTCVAAALGNDLGVYLHTLLACFVVSAIWI